MSNFEEFHVLLVEDNPDSREAAKADLEREIPESVIFVAGDREAAVKLLEERRFDLAVCDLKIPARAGELLTHEDNGLSIVSMLQAQFPGTPVVILSAYGTLENTEAYTSGADVLPALGMANLPMCQAAKKGGPSSLSSRLRPIREGLTAIAEVRFEGPPDLSVSLKRALSQFASARGMSDVEVRKAGGLSGSSNAIVRMRGAGGPEKRIFVKADRRDWLLDELRRRELYVEGTLDPSNWAATIQVLKAGLRGQAAYFSSLATDPSSMFELVRTDETMAISAFERLKQAVLPWRVQTTEQVNVGDLRRIHFPDEYAAEHHVSLDEFDDIEAVELAVSKRIIHGDFHGDNILVVDGSRPLLVDFAYTGVGPAALDAVTLEMSFLFHPASPLVRKGIPVAYEKWAQGAYLTTPVGSQLTARCREWALSEVSANEFHAMSYAHAVRQLKHDTPKDAVWAVIRSSADALRG